MAKLDFITGGDNFITSNGLQYRVEGERAYTVDSFDVLLYHSNADHNQVDKTPDLTSARAYKGTLRRGTSLINPVITIQHPTTWFWNYMYIPEFQRYYFITDVVSVNLFLWEIHAHVDVLMTYKSGIADLTTRVLRSDSEANWEIQDNLIPPHTYTVTGRYAPSNRSGVWVYPVNNLSLTAASQVASYGHFMFRLICSSYIYGGASYSNTLTGSIWCTTAITNFGSFLDRIYNASYLDGVQNINSIVCDVKWMPCHFMRAGPRRKLSEIRFENQSAVAPFMWVDDLDIYAIEDAVKCTETITWSFTGLPIQSVGYRNNPPYKTMGIIFPPFGQMELDAQTWGRKTAFDVVCEVDSISGDAILYVADGSYRECIGNANVALPINIYRTDPDNVSLVKSLTSGLSGIISAGSVMGALVTGAKTAIDTMLIPPKIYSLSSSGEANSLAQSNPTLIIRRLPQDNPNVGRIAIVDGREKVIAGTQGWLLNKDRKLSTLWGYTVVAGGVHIEGVGFRNCTTQERDELEQLLTSGVILPKQI